MKIMLTILFYTLCTGTGFASEATTPIADSRLAFPPPMATLAQAKQVMDSNAGVPAIVAIKKGAAHEPAQPAQSKMGIYLLIVFALCVVASILIALAHGMRQALLRGVSLVYLKIRGKREVH
jgi:hypothetical protein